MNYKKKILKLLEEVDETNEKGLRMIYGFVRSISEMKEEKEKTGS